MMDERQMFRLLLTTITVAAILMMISQRANAGTAWVITGGDGTEYPSPSAACATMTVPGSSTHVAYEGPTYSDGGNPNCLIQVQRCRLGGYSQPLSSCDENTLSISNYDRIFLTEVEVPDENHCEVLDGVTFSLVTDGFPPSSQCVGGCSTSVIAGGCLGDFCSADYEYTETQCDATPSPIPDSSYVSSDGTTNTEISVVGGVETTTAQYPAPSPPESDLDPVTDGDQPPVQTDQATHSNGTTVTQYEMVGGGSVYVITDSSGAVTMTDKDPTTGSGQYVAGTGDGGTGDGGTGDGGTGDGGTGDGGTGDGDGEEGEGEDRLSSGGISCDVAPVCSGDAINCAIVMQAWETRCEAQELKDDLMTEVDSDAISSMGVANDVVDAIESLGEGAGNFDSPEATGLADGFTSDVVEDTLDDIPTTGSFAFMNITLFGASLPIGTKLTEHWATVSPVFAFGMWLMTAAGIYLMWFGAMMGIKP